MDSVVVVNLKTSGHWEYTNFKFNSMVFHNGQYIAATDTGISQLTTPAPRTVVGEVKTGELNADATRTTYMADVYADCRGEMDLELDTTVDEDRVIEYSFAVRTEKEGRHSKRFKLAKGVKSNSWALTVRNVVGSNFDVLAVTPMVVQSVRSK